MKAHIIGYTSFFYLLISSCNMITKDNMVVLSEFAEDLLKAYINDTIIGYTDPKNEVLVFNTFIDQAYYRIVIYAIDKDCIGYISSHVIQQTNFSGYTTYLTGDPSNPFFKTKKKLGVWKKNNRGNGDEIDPIEYVIYLNKRMELDYLRTYRINIYEDISQIESIVERHFETQKTFESSDNRVFYSHEVQDLPKFPGGEFALERFIGINFHINRSKIQPPSLEMRRSLVSVNLLIDQEGNATFYSLLQSSGDYDIDQEAIRVAKLISQFKFEPAQHRGHVVKILYIIGFYDRY